MMQIGAAVESMIHASFSWLMLNRSVTGAHDRAHREAVEVVVHEDDDAQHRSENLRHLRVLDVRRHPLGVRARSAGGRDDHHERAQ